jgi:hypothetical protein
MTRADHVALGSSGGPVGFAYEVRCRRGGGTPDAAAAAGGRVRVGNGTTGVPRSWNSSARFLSPREDATGARARRSESPVDEEASIECAAVLGARPRPRHPWAPIVKVELSTGLNLALVYRPQENLVTVSARDYSRDWSRNSSEGG